MDARKPGLTYSKLFVTSTIECRDELDERHDRCFQLLTALYADKSPKDVMDTLISTMGKDPKTHEDICVGFVVAILGTGVDSSECVSRYFHDLSLSSRDGLQCVCAHLNHLVVDKYPKMSWGARHQLLWLVREMVQNQIGGMDSLCWNLMRQIAGGDTSRNNLWLADSLLDIFIKNRAWLDKFQFLVASVVYTYLRLIEDHFHAQFEKLREKEVKFVVSLIRDRFVDVMLIGRDLVRVLQHVARIPDIEAVWRDIVHNPRNLTTSFSGIVHLMQTRTSRRFLLSRVTPEMEKKLVFLTSQVRFGSHKRYQEWFQQKYLSTTESQSLRCDLIRFIVGVIHPSNEVLGSDIIPRWAVIGWLLTTCTSQVAAANAKLALFYDWLFFDPDKDNIMNVEPAILVMHHSMRPHPAITATLLDFICRIIVNFLPQEHDKVRSGIYASLRQILDKRVLPSLSPLFDNPRLDRELRTMLRERFTPFVGKNESEELPELVMATSDDNLVVDVGHHDTGLRFSDDEEEDGGNGKRPPQDHVNSNAPATTILDGTDELAASAVIGSNKSLKKKSSSRSTGPVQTRRERVKCGELNEDDETDLLDSQLKDLLNELRQQEDGESQCESVEQLVKCVIQEQCNFAQCRYVATQMAEILHEHFEGKIFPEEPSAEAIEDSMGRPLFVVFRALVEMSDSDPHRHHLLHLLAELYTLKPRVGYYLLYFLSADRQVRPDPKVKCNVYRDLCEAIDVKFSLDICLVNDMRQCQEDDVYLFVYLVPEIYTNFPKASIGNVDLLYLVVSCVDGRQVYKLACDILSKDFIIFKKDCYQTVLNASLNWETFEQYALWQLLAAHDMPLECVLPLLPKLCPVKHSEALHFILLLIKQEKPSAELLKYLLARAVSHTDRFVSSILGYWIQEYHEKLGDLISNHLIKQSSGGAHKRKRNQQPTGNTRQPLSQHVELVLSHLDQLRQTCKQYDFFNLRNIQSALQQIRHLCTDSQKKKFMDLFALADSDFEDELPLHHSKSKGGSSSSGGSSGGGNAAAMARSINLSSSSSSNSAATTSAKSSAKSPSKSKSAKKVSDSSCASSGESEEDKPVSRGRTASRGGSRSSGSSGVKYRKRPASKVSSYKERDSSEESSDDIVIPAKKSA